MSFFPKITAFCESQDAANTKSPSKRISRGKQKKKNLIVVVSDL